MLPPRAMVHLPLSEAIASHRPANLSPSRYTTNEVSAAQACGSTPGCGPTRSFSTCRPTRSRSSAVSAGKLPIRLERVGRPEIKNVILSWKEYDAVNRDLEVRDLYNLEDAFHLGKDYRGVSRSRLDANLAAFDRLDGKTDWPLDANGAHPLTELLLAEHRVVEVSKPYAEDSFFEIERAALAGRAHATCGGRSLNDDVMDTLLTLLIAS